MHFLLGAIFLAWLPFALVQLVQVIFANAIAWIFTKGFLIFLGLMGAAMLVACIPAMFNY